MGKEQVVKVAVEMAMKHRLKSPFHPFTLCEFMESRLVTPDSAAKRLLKFSAMAVVMAVGKKNVVWQYMITKPIQSCGRHHGIEKDTIFFEIIRAYINVNSLMDGRPVEYARKDFINHIG